jgi:diaminohydroxyphosphoribosylaminopyrimidine deaminase / 5-amino-6-(5-phosphoribosylamino)uracil reductase
VGTQTVLTDNPQLNNRYYFGKQPVRMIIDKNLATKGLSVWDTSMPTVIFNNLQSEQTENVTLVKVANTETYLYAITHYCCLHKITSLLVEGGNKTLQFFIDAGFWDEIIVVKNPHLTMQNGVKAPCIAPTQTPYLLNTLENNYIEHYKQPF